MTRFTVADWAVAMRVLLTGAAGFIGRHVHAELTRQGIEVIALDSLRSDVHKAPPRTPFELVVADVRDGAALDRALRGVDAVCHLAAKVGLGVAVGDLPDYADTNDRGTAELLAAMARRDVGRLILASSMVVYGEGVGQCATHGNVVPGPRSASLLSAGQFEPPCPICAAPLAPALVDEQARTDPRNGYAATKLAQEHLASSWARLTGGAVTTLRYHNVYGPGMPRDTPYAGVAAIFLSALRSGARPTVFEDGGQRRDFVHVTDIASATVAAVRRPVASPIEVYNVGSGQPRTVGQMAAALATAVGGPPPRVTKEFRLGDVRHITADSARIRDRLGWSPSVVFEDGIASLAELETARAGLD